MLGVLDREKIADDQDQFTYCAAGKDDSSATSFNIMIVFLKLGLGEGLECVKNMLNKPRRVYIDGKHDGKTAFVEACYCTFYIHSFLNHFTPLKL